MRCICDRQLDRCEQSKDDEPGTEDHLGRNPLVSSNGQNWETKDLTPRVIFLPLAYSGHAI